MGAHRQPLDHCGHHCQQNPRQRPISKGPDEDGDIRRVIFQEGGRGEDGEVDQVDQHHRHRHQHSHHCQFADFLGPLDLFSLIHKNTPSIIEFSPLYRFDWKKQAPNPEKTPGASTPGVSQLPN